ncbi:homocysteine S-methyltransferase family protein [uncultured Acetobacteroides sp.]|uniref:homocysteine S-methyltransferase family protein n=1 Tax=uncultured Acetobacteroides sp. TaxID=1760811 RepID=UPI0029F494FB|nr:homocysteine S-methyltransferase family protein [uncultured Acetobacteroides sp.]
MNFVECLSCSRTILTEGALVERLKNELGLTMDPYVNHAGLIYDNPDALATFYRQYIAIAQRYDTPIMLMTPTRRVNADTVPQSKYANKSLIADACAYLKGVRADYVGFIEKIFVGGLLGCKGDAYNPVEALGEEEAYRFHKIQVNEFAKQKVDFLFAGIMPAISESIGMARAMEESEIPYIISFMVKKDGRLLDGTPIAEAIDIVDRAVDALPVGYMANCIHPSNLIQALEQEVNANLRVSGRFLGIQANASSLEPDELNCYGALQQEDFDEMVDKMLYLANEHQLKILGGCCGTDDIFIEKLAVKIKQSVR